MINIYRTEEEQGNVIEIESIDKLEKNSWINLINPTDEEVNIVANKLGINNILIKYALDSEEQARIDIDDDQVLILVDIPTVESNSVYTTMPLGILVVRDEYIITICLKNISLYEEFIQGKVKQFYTHMKTRFILQMLYRIAQNYLKYLKLINKETDKAEFGLRKSMQNKELIKLLDIEKGLVYFSTSLRGNEIVMEKLLKGRIIKIYEDDGDLLEDTIIENKQAIEMAQIYSDILSGMMDAFASIISNNLNVVMKFLTAITIIISIPTMIASFFGMNVHIPPFSTESYSFYAIILASVIVSILAAIALKRKNMM